MTLAEESYKHSISQALAYWWHAVAQHATTQAPQQVDSRGGPNPMHKLYAYTLSPRPHIYRRLTGRFRFALGGCHASRETGTRAKGAEVARGAGVSMVE